MGGRKGVAKSKAAPKVKSLPDAPMASTDCINAEVMARLAVHDAHIKDAFDDLLTTSPTNESGFPAYKEIDAVAALTAHRPYVCACPLYWLNLAFEFQPNLPKYQKRLDNLEAHFFEEPKNLTEPIVVYLNPGELPHKMVGSLRAFDASEMRDALRQAVSHAISNKKSKKILNQWHGILLSTPFRFEACSVDTIERKQLFETIVFYHPFCETGMQKQVMEEKNRLQTAFKTIVQQREDLVVKKENMAVPCHRLLALRWRRDGAEMVLGQCRDGAGMAPGTVAPGRKKCKSVFA